MTTITPGFATTPCACTCTAARLPHGWVSESGRQALFSSISDWGQGSDSVTKTLQRKASDLYKTWVDFTYMFYTQVCHGRNTYFIRFFKQLRLFSLKNKPSRNRGKISTEIPFFNLERRSYLATVEHANSGESTTCGARQIPVHWCRRTWFHV